MFDFWNRNWLRWISPSTGWRTQSSSFMITVWWRRWSWSFQKFTLSSDCSLSVILSWLRRKRKVSDVYEAYIIKGWMEERRIETYIIKKWQVFSFVKLCLSLLSLRWSSNHILWMIHNSRFDLTLCRWSGVPGSVSWWGRSGHSSAQFWICVSLSDPWDGDNRRDGDSEELWVTGYPGLQ